MALLPPVVATLLADTKDYSAKMDAAQGKMDALGKSSTTTGQRISSGLNKASSAVIGAGLVVAGVSLKMATDFQTATTALVTGAGESAKNLEMVRQGLLNLAGQVGQTPIELAKGMYMIESAGFHGAEGLKVLRAAAQGAAVGAADMQTVADALTTSLHDYNIPATQATQVTSALIATVASGKTHLEDLANSLGRVLPTASALKIPLDNLLGSVATLTNSGMTARLATTDLNSAIVGLAAPSKTAEKALAAMGLSSQELVNAMRDPRVGLQGAFKLITDAAGKEFPIGSAAYLNAVKQMTGTSMGLKVALDLTGKSAVTVTQNTKTIGAAMKGAADNVRGWSQVQKDLSFQLHSLGANAQSIAIGIGDWLLPKATAVAKWASGVIAYFKAHPLVGKIASDAAIAAFGAAVAFKIGKAIQSVVGTIRSLFGTTELAANTTATTSLSDALIANTAAVEANTGALGGTAAAGGVGAAAAGAGGAVGVESAAKTGVVAGLGSVGLDATGIGAILGLSYVLGRNTPRGAVAAGLAGLPNRFGQRTPVHKSSAKKVTVTLHNRYGR